MTTSPSRRLFLRSLGAASTLAALGLATSAVADEVVADPWRFTTSTGQASRIDFPSGWTKAQRVPLVIQFRGLNQTGDTFQRAEMATAANGVGWAVATSYFHGNGYGSPTVMADLRALLAKAAAAGVQFSAIALWGNSMGGAAALNAVTNKVVVPAGVYLTDPVVSLRQRYDSIRRDQIAAAYGIAADGSNYDAKTAGYDPALRPAADYPAVPYRIVASRGDTLVPLAAHGQVLVTKLGSTRVKLLDVATSGHNTNDRFRTYDFSSWLQSLPVAAAPPPPSSSGFVADTFTVTGALGGSLTSTGGARWTLLAGGGGGVAGGEIVRSGGTVGPRSTGISPSTLFASVDVGATSYSVETTVTGLAASPAGQGGGLAVRVGSGTGLWINNRVDGATAGYALYQRTSGTAVIAKRTDVLPAVGDRLRVTVSGATITAYVNGTQIMQVSNSLNATSTRAGLFFNRPGVASRFDDFARVA